MAFTSFKKPLVFYYGCDHLHDLTKFQRAVLQPAHYSAADLTWLKGRQVTPLAYVSLGEDAGPPAPWQRPQTNAAWDTAYVHADDPGWQRQVARQVEAALTKGFEGLFLDTLDTADLFPEDRAALLRLVAQVRSQLGARPLLANRGFSLLPDLANLIDGVVFEAFSTRWLPGGGCATLGDGELEWTAARAADLRALGVPAYALDYCPTGALARFARRRARRYGLVSIVSNRELTCV